MIISSFLMVDVGEKTDPKSQAQAPASCVEDD